MTSLEIVKKLYPDAESDGGYFWFSAYSYWPMIESFGIILCEGSFGSYKGDTFVLYVTEDNPPLYGFLSYGWGSCSGCDALAGCDSFEEVAKLYDNLKNAIVWRTKEETLKWLKEHDWEGDWSYYYDEAKECVDKMIQILET